MLPIILDDCKIGRRSQWPRDLRHEPSPPSRTLGSWVRIPIEAWMSVVHLLCVCVVVCVVSGLATGWSPVQGVLPSVYRIKKPKNGHGPKGHRARERENVCKIGLSWSSWLHFGPEDGGSTFLWNVSGPRPDYMTPHHRTFIYSHNSQNLKSSMAENKLAQATVVKSAIVHLLQEYYN
jgi:hypothetical protein